MTESEQLEVAQETISPVLYKFSNEAETPWLDSILAMFYQGAFDNRLGIMDSFNLDSEEVETILVGVEADENGKPMCYPLAKLIKAEHVTRYLSPDGKGGFFDPFNPAEAAEARESMKTIEEATVG